MKSYEGAHFGLKLYLLGSSRRSPFLLLFFSSCCRLVLCIPLLVIKTVLTLHEKIGKVVGGIQDENQFRSHQTQAAGGGGLLAGLRSRPQM